MPKINKIFSLFLGAIFIFLIFLPASDLHEAAKQGNIAEINRLLDRGVDIEAKDNYGNTPLHYAAHKNRSEAITILLNRGANAKAKSAAGKLPIDIANDNNVEKNYSYWRLHDASY